MAVDEFGRDLGAVAIPVTGDIAFAPYGTILPTPVELADPTYKLPEAWRKLGLITEDGGPEWTLEPDGDGIEFWQDGYILPTGVATCELTFTAAQTNGTVREFLRGKQADANGYMTIDAGGTPVRYAIYVEEIFKNKTIRRRIAAAASIKEIKEAKSERGEVLGYEVTLTISSHPSFNNEHIGEALLPAPAA